MQRQGGWHTNQISDTISETRSHSFYILSHFRSSQTHTLYTSIMKYTDKLSKSHQNSDRVDFSLIKANLLCWQLSTWARGWQYSAANSYRLTDPVLNVQSALTKTQFAVFVMTCLVSSLPPFPFPFKSGIFISINNWGLAANGVKQASNWSQGSSGARHGSPCPLRLRTLILIGATADSRLMNYEIICLHQCREREQQNESVRAIERGSERMKAREGECMR